MTAPDPGNLPARMAEVIASHKWDGFPRSAHNQHNYYAECAVCQRDIPRMAEVALGVRDELVAHLSARAMEAEARVEHAEAGAQLSSERLAEVRQELAEAKARADKAEYDLEIRTHTARSNARAHRVAYLESEKQRQRAESAEAERDRLRLAWQSARERAKAYGDSMTRLSAAWGGAEGAIDRVRALHSPETDPRRTPDCKGCRTDVSFVYHDRCKTIAALSAPAEGTTTPARETA